MGNMKKYNIVCIPFPKCHFAPQIIVFRLNFHDLEQINNAIHSGLVLGQSSNPLNPKWNLNHDSNLHM